MDARESRKPLFSTGKRQVAEPVAARSSVSAASGSAMASLICNRNLALFAADPRIDHRRGRSSERRGQEKEAVVVQDILRVAATSDQLLNLTERELQLVLLRHVATQTDDQFRGMTFVGGISTELFNTVGFFAGLPYASRAAANEVDRRIKRAARRLESADLIHEPDPTNGANGARVVTPKRTPSEDTSGH